MTCSGNHGRRSGRDVLSRGTKWTVTAEMLDQLLHHAHIAQLTGEPYRLKNSM
jgi:hypothetical protein